MSWAEAQAIEGTDWIQETIRTGVKQGYDFSASKGFKGGNFYAGLSYNDNHSYLAGNSYERISGRFNVDYNLASNLKLGISTSISRGINNRIDAAWSGGFGEAMSRALPIYPVRYSEDEYDADGNVIASAGDYWLKEWDVGTNCYLAQPFFAAKSFMKLARASAPSRGIAL